MNFTDEVTHYSRKDYNAEVRLIAVDGHPCSTKDMQNVEIIKTHFWANYSETPKYLYSVFDTTNGTGFGRGFIFYVRYGWAFIARTGESTYWSPYPTLDFFSCWESWCQTPSEATAKTIRGSRSNWGKKMPQQPIINSCGSLRDRDCQILGLTSPFNASQLKQVYRKLCLKHHPDRGGNVAKFREINEAYNRLKTKVQSWV